MMGTRFGWELVELLHEGERSSIYRASRHGGGPSVVLKVPSGRAGPLGARRLEREWEALRQLQHAGGVVRGQALEQEGERRCLVLEDTQGVPLDQLARAGRLALVDVLDVAIGVVEALEAVHRARWMHADLNPSNILVSGAERRVVLIDFASATRWASEPARARSARLAYLSPEQTGRMNRSVDQRSDFYSFGVVLYELLVGVVPFQQTDALELLHAHVAREPRSPSELRPELPRVLERLVLRLLAKDAEDRYQSAFGLRRDLLRCRQELEALQAEGAGQAIDFELGSFDRAESFRVPRRLYGRGAELSRLSAAWEGTAAGARWLVVEGPAGIGKSSAIAQLASPVAASGGLFASGKFEQYERSSPYVAFSRILEVLLEQLLAGSAEQLGRWRSQLLAALPSAGAVLGDLCPGLELVLGPLPAAPPLPAREARVRLQHALASCLEALVRSKGPLCLVFDDLHWADVDSVELLQQLALGTRALPLLLVVAYREAELGEQHPLRALLAAAPEQGMHVERVALGPLAEEDVGQLVRDATATALPQARELAELVVARTGGNPFFVRSFLDSSSADGLLELGRDGWVFHLDRIRQRGITDNVVELLVERIRKLPAATQRMLQPAACLGHRFDLATLSAVMGQSVGADLEPAIAAELVLELELPAANAAGEPWAASHQFTHDRVQQAVLSLLDDATRRGLHLRVGRWLAASSSGELSGRRLFEAAGHLNRAAELLGVEERGELVRLNLEAARAALRRAAGLDALQFARAGIAVLGGEGWSAQYAAARDLHLVAAEAAFGAGDHEAVETLVEQSLAHARAGLDGVRARMLRGSVHFGAARFREAMATYLEALAELDIVIPQEPSADQVADEQRRTAQALQGKAVGDLLALPSCADARMQVAAELLSKVILLAGSMSDRVLPVAACQLVRLSLEHGNTAESANAYTFYGQLLSADHDLDRAYEFGKLALDVCNRFTDRAVRSQTYIYANYQLVHWKATFPELVAGLRTALQYGLEAGSPFNAACSAVTLCIARLWSGEPLGTLSLEFEANRQIILRFRQGVVLNWHEIWQQAVDNLRLDPASPATLAGPIYDEAARLPVHTAGNDAGALFNYHLSRGLICLLLGDGDAALGCMEGIQPYRELFATGLWAYPFTFLDALCRLAACAGADAQRREALLGRVEEALQKMSGWLPHNRRILEHKVRLLQAEVAAVQGDLLRARQLFAEAVPLAAESGILHEEALAGELAARCSFRQGEREEGRTYLRAAHRAYLKWGALTKVRALERQFPGSLPRVATGSANVLAMFGRDYELDPLDLVSLIDAGQAVASEIKLERLLRQLLRLLIESAGAQHGYLLLPRGGQWLVEAGQSSELGLVTLLESIALDDVRAAAFGMLPSVVNYVTRTGVPVSFDDVAQSPLFGPEALARGVAGSLCCFGLKRQGEILALAYLENRLVPGAFTPRGQRLLEALANQAVTSLENAMLYTQLEQKVELRTRELVEKNDALESALVRLTEMREQLVTQEKLAALGALTAGIAHEIKNPLNFVTNFALVAATLVEEIRALLVSRSGAAAGSVLREVEPLLGDLGEAVRKVNEHGSRASGIVSGMALHARESGGPREYADLNAVLARSLQLSCEARRNGNTPIALETSYDERVGLVEVAVQDISRVFVNIINNACYAVEQKRAQQGPGFAPRVSVSTRDLGQRVEVRIRDNGTGIPALSRDKIFLPFFTTKAPREGTGLGLSISHDIVVRAHGGELRVESQEAEFAEFILVLPRRVRHAGASATVLAAGPAER